jgi:ABC-type multidrug transport system fused ATPase/permease subunit
LAAEPSGQQVSRITYTSEQVASASTDALKVAVTDGFTVIAMLYVMLHNSAYLTLSLLVMVPAIALVATVVSRRYRQISRRIQGGMGSVTGTVEESVGAHREVRIYGGQTYEAGRFDRITEHTRRLNLKIAATNAASSSTIQLVAATALAGTGLSGYAAAGAQRDVARRFLCRADSDGRDDAVAEAPYRCAGEYPARSFRRRGSVRGHRHAARDGRGTST